MVDGLFLLFALVGFVGSIVTIGTWAARQVNPLRSIAQGFIDRTASELNWTQALESAEEVLQQLEADSDWEPDVVIGIGRSGAIWAGWLAGNLGSKPVAVVDAVYEVEETGVQTRLPGLAESLAAIAPTPVSILLVEGATARGSSFASFLTSLETMAGDRDVRLATLYRATTCLVQVNYVGEVLEAWPERFPWHHRRAYQRHTTRLR